jgi:predicted Zn-dependent peptidase
VSVAAGSKYETAETAGSAFLLEHMAFKSSNGKSALRTVRDMEELGGTFGSASSRDQVTYSATVLDSALPTAMAIISDTVLSSDLKDWEIDGIKGGTHLVARAESGENPAVLLSEGVCAAAFKDNTPLGHPMIVEGPSASSLQSFVDTQFVGGNITVAGAGVSHSELSELAQKYFGGAASGSSTAISSTYSGGETRTNAMSDTTYIAYGFEGAGLKGDVATMSVLEQVLAAKGFSAFSVAYGETGLFGIHAATAAGTEKETLDGIIAAFKSDVTDAEVDAAKKNVGLSYANGKAATAEFFATSGSEKLPAVGAVTTASVSAMLSKGGAPFLASLGSMATMPYLGSL